MVLFTCVSIISFRCLRSIAAYFFIRVFKPNVGLQHLAQDFIAFKSDQLDNEPKSKKGENHIWHRIDFHLEVTMASSGTGFAFGNLQRFNDTGRQPWPMPAHAASRASDRAVSTSNPYRSASPSASRHFGLLCPGSCCSS